MHYRQATAGDATAIAGLHADSWRRHYRGAFLDSYLDGDVVTDRMAEWTGRLSRPASDRYTLVADLNGGVAGFAHVIFDADPVWGAYLDNLHVRYDIKRRGTGARLLAGTATGRAYMCELIRLRDGRSELNYAIYHDRYQRTGDGWKFTERAYEVRYLDHSPLAGSAPHAAEDAS